MRIKSLYILLMVLVPILIGILLYKIYGSYTSSTALSQKKDSLHLVSQLATLESALADEKLKSALFLGVKGVNYLNDLENTRKEVDYRLNSLKTNISKKANALLEENKLDQFAKQIKKNRAMIDALDPTNEKLFEIARINAVSELLPADESPYTLVLEDGEHNKDISAYLDVVGNKVSLLNERAILSFYLARHEKLSNKHLLIWEHALEGNLLKAKNEEMRDLTGISDGGLNTTNINKYLSNLRGDVFEHAHDGRFATKPYEIEDIYAQPLSLMRHGEGVLYERIVESLELEQSKNNISMIQYIIGVLVLLGVLLILIRLIKSSKQEKIALEESLREITTDLDDEHRKELELIISRGDRGALYRFLSKITLDARAAEERALQAEKTKDLFLANMSHEIRTPLNGILGFTQLMIGTPLNPEQEEFMGVIEGSSDNLLKIVNDILDLSKIKANKIELESIPFSIIEHMEKAIEPLAAKALENGIEYSTFIDPALPKIIGDSTKLRQVLTNLIGNAIKFTNEGGTVDVDIRKIKDSPHGDTIRFSVKDSGIGIDSEKLEKIFEPFTQADVSTTREFGGTGLGLTITRDIIAQMGGKLAVDSEPGHGSEFYFELVFEGAGDDEDVKNKLEGVKVAYYHAGHSTLRQIERNLALYIRSSGGRYRVVGDNELDMLDDIDFIIIDYTNQETRDNMDTLLALGKKTILISTASGEHLNDDLSNRVDQIIYRPLTISKIVRAYDNLSSKSKAKEDGSKTAEVSFSLSGLKVLVAEDNPINQKLIARVLQDMGVSATLVNNGEEAFEKSISESYDAVLMDIQMPVMGGIESTHKILEYEHNQGIRHTPIVALTANALQGDREKYLKEGFDDYISKPINLDQLRLALKASHANLLEREAISSGETVSSEMADVLPPHSDVLMLSRTKGLIVRLHKDALAFAGYTFSSVDNSESLLKILELSKPKYVLLDFRSVTQYECEIINKISQNGALAYIYGTLETPLKCNGKYDTYSSISELIKKL